VDDDQDDIEIADSETPEGHPWRTTILPPMPTWMAEGRDPPHDAVVPKRKNARSVVFAFESIASRQPDPAASGEASEVRTVVQPLPPRRRDRVA